MAKAPHIGLLLSVSLFLTACSDSANTPVTELSIPFVAKAHQVEIDCDAELVDLGTDDANATIKSFAFYVHDVVLINSDNSELPVSLKNTDWQGNDVGLIDFQDKTDSCASEDSKPTNSELLGTVRGNLDDVVGLRFTVGVPNELNHEDASSAEAPLNRTDLFWSWQSGYKHMRMDVAAEDSAVSTWNIHLGSTGCTGDAANGEAVTCTADNQPVIELALGDDIRRQQVRVDYGKLVEDSALKSNQGGAPGCMSGATDPECSAIFDALGLGLGENADPTAGQTVFSVEDANTLD